MFQIATTGLIVGITIIIAGIIILIWQRLLTYIVAAYIIIIGIVAILYVVF